MEQKHIIIPIFIPHKGCPFDCIYCNQKSISGKTDAMDVEKVRSEIDAHLATVGAGAEVEVAFYGGSFTGIPREQQIAYLEVANEYIYHGKVNSIRLSTRPDYIEEDILTYLKRYRVKTIELGVQSLDSEVLVQSCRGHSIEHVLKAAKMIRQRGFVLGIQTMIGLPGDNRAKDIATAHAVVGLMPELVRIYPTLVIRGTFLEKLYREGAYHPLDLEQAVDTCAELLELYQSHQIQVIRIGLQASGNINAQSDVVAGPFHPAFRQLVEARLAMKEIISQITTKGLAGKEVLILRTAPQNISNVVGQKKRNIAVLKEKYGYKDVKVKAGNPCGKEIEVEAI